MSGKRRSELEWVALASNSAVLGRREREGERRPFLSIFVFSSLDWTWVDRRHHGGGAQSNKGIAPTHFEESHAWIRASTALEKRIFESVIPLLFPMRIYPVWALETPPAVCRPGPLDKRISKPKTSQQEQQAPCPIPAPGVLCVLLLLLLVPLLFPELTVEPAVFQRDPRSFVGAVESKSEKWP